MAEADAAGREVGRRVHERVRSLLPHQPERVEVTRRDLVVGTADRIAVRVHDRCTGVDDCEGVGRDLLPVVGTFGFVALVVAPLMAASMITGVVMVLLCGAPGFAGGGGDRGDRTDEHVVKFATKNSCVVAGCRCVDCRDLRSHRHCVGQLGCRGTTARSGPSRGASRGTAAGGRTRPRVRFADETGEVLGASRTGRADCAVSMSVIHTADAGEDHDQLLDPEDPDAFVSHYVNTHVPLVNDLPGRAFEWGRALTNFDGSPPEAFWVISMTFDSEEALRTPSPARRGRRRSPTWPNYKAGSRVSVVSEVQ